MAWQSLRRTLWLWQWAFLTLCASKHEQRFVSPHAVHAISSQSLHVVPRWPAAFLNRSGASCWPHRSQGCVCIRRKAPSFTFLPAASH